MNSIYSLYKTQKMERRRVTRNSGRGRKKEYFKEDGEEYFEQYPLTAKQEEEFKKFNENQKRVQTKKYKEAREKHFKSAQTNNVGRWMGRNRWNKEHPIRNKYQWAIKQNWFVVKNLLKNKSSRRSRRRAKPTSPGPTPTLTPPVSTPAPTEAPTPRTERVARFLQKKRDLENEVDKESEVIASTQDEEEENNKIRTLIGIERDIATLEDQVRKGEKKQYFEGKLKKAQETKKQLMRELLPPSLSVSPRAPSPNDITPPDSPRDSPSPSRSESPVNGVVSTQGIVFVNNVSSRITYERILRTPITVSEIINWGEARKRFVHKRFCENIIRVIKRIAPRSKHGFSVIKGILNRLTVHSYSDTDLYDQYMPIVFQKHNTMFIEDELMFPNTGFPNGPLNTAVLYYDGNMIPVAFNRIVRPIVGRAHALSNEAVFVIKNYFGRQINVDNSGVNIQGNFDINSEKYRIPRKELLQMLFLMKCYNREKAVLQASFEPEAIEKLLKPLFRSEFNVGETVYKPWFNYEEDDVKTLITKSKMVFKQALFRMCYELSPSDIQLDIRNETATRRWNPTWLGNTGDQRRSIYKAAMQTLDVQYNEFVKNWGGANTGQQILDLIENKSIQGYEDEEVEGGDNEMGFREPIIVQPLFQLERLDVVFSELRLNTLFTGIFNAVQGQFEDVSLFVNIDDVAKRANEAVFTQTLRDIKKGRIITKNDSGYTVDWEVPHDTRTGIHNMNMSVVSTESELSLRRKNSQTAAFLLSKVSRVSSPLKFADSALSIVEMLRNGELLDYNKVTSILKKTTKQMYVAMELDLSERGMVVNGNFQPDGDGTKTRLDHVYELFIIPLIQAVESITTVRCKGSADLNWEKKRGRGWVWVGEGEPMARIKPVVERVNDVMRELDKYFVGDLYEEDNDAKSVTRYATVTNVLIEN
jgi:hypothetical protein